MAKKNNKLQPPEINTTPKLFGAYVVSVSTSLSWGSQGATSQFQLVEDPDNNVNINIPPMGSPVIFPPKEYDDNGDLIKFGSFTYEEPLSSGLLQRWTYSESFSGRTYDAVITSPATILSGVQIVLNKFNGNGHGGLLTNEVANIFNVYAHYENILVGGNYGTQGQGGFGDSAVEKSGFALGAYNEDNEIVNLLDTIVQMTFDPNYSYFGNPIRHGNYQYELDFSELGTAIASRDLWYYRISGDSRDLASIIDEVCEILQADWMIQLEERVGRPRPTLMVKLVDRSQPFLPGVIKDYVISARQSGTLISCSYGEELSDATTGKVVVGAPVSRYLDRGIEHCVPMWGKLGGTSGLGWLPHPPEIGLGLMPSADKVYTRDKLVDPNYKFAIILPEYGAYQTSLLELRLLTGDATAGKRSWSLFKVFQTLAGFEPNGYEPSDLVDAPWFSDIQVDLNVVEQLVDQTISIQDTQQTRLKQNKKINRNASQQEFEKFFAALTAVAQNSFCRQFMVRVPLDLEDGWGLSDAQLHDENVRYINTYGSNSVEQYDLSWDVMPDAWALDPQVGRPDFFNRNGRLKGMVGWKKILKDGDWGFNVDPMYSDPTAIGGVDQGNEVDVEKLGRNWQFASPLGAAPLNNMPWDSGPGFTRGFQLNPATAAYQNIVENAQAGGGQGYTPSILDFGSPKVLSFDGGPVEKQTYNIADERSTASMYVPCATKVSPMIDDEMTTEMFGVAVFAKIFFDKDLPLDIFYNGSAAHLKCAIPPLRSLPIGFGIPQQSNKYRYGPWAKAEAQGNADPSIYTAGKAEFQVEESLAPENFGGYSKMNEAGFILTDIDTGRVDVSETGFVELVGVPEYNIGKRFQDSGPFVTDLDIAVGIDGIKHTYKFNTWTPSFGKLAKANIDILKRSGKIAFENLQGGGSVVPINQSAAAAQGGGNGANGLKKMSDLVAPTFVTANVKRVPEEEEEEGTNGGSTGGGNTGGGNTGGGNTGGGNTGGGNTGGGNTGGGNTGGGNTGGGNTGGGNTGGSSTSYQQSDRRLKTDIERVGTSPKGIPIYEFRFKDNLDIKYQGTIAQDLLEMGMGDVVGKGENGFYTVDYDTIDVEQVVLTTTTTNIRNYHDTTR
jgi:hypothetical protein